MPSSGNLRDSLVWISGKLQDKKFVATSAQVCSHFFAISQSHDEYIVTMYL